MENPYPPQVSSDPADPPELPSSIFYAIVCDDDTGMKPKAYRRRSFLMKCSFTSYVQVRCKYNLTKSTYEPSYVSCDVPTLFDTKAEAEQHRQAAMDFFNLRGSSTVQFRLQVFRIVESTWHPSYRDSDVCAFHDARRMATGILHYRTVADHIKKLAGKVLTVLDAAYINDNQNKAVKDLTKNSFRSQLSELYKTAHEDPDCESSESSADVKDILD